MDNATYTYVTQYGNKILSRGYYDETGERFNRKDDFAPTLFINSKRGNPDTPWRDLYGKKLYEIKPGTIKECKEFIEQYKDVDGFEVHGMTSWVTQFISEEYQHDIKLVPKFCNVASIDIETTVEDGFPDVKTATEEILLITQYNSINDHYIVYTSRDIELLTDILIENKVDPNKVSISKHIDEYHMLKTFVTDWATNYPDVLTGWNTGFFDVPYLINRIMRILGESFVNKLSPWGMVRDRMVKINNDDQLTYDIIGINQLDYIDLMKKYTYGGRESWKLDNVAYDELGMRKLGFDGSFKDHYTKEWNHFAAYNICDVSLVVLMDRKLKLIDLALTIAYDSRVNPDEVFSQIRSWDSLIYNELKRKNIVIPNKTNNRRDQFEGAYVKEPIIGKHKWTVSFDLQSLYPHLMMWANISPETIASYTRKVNVEKLLAKDYDLSDLVEQNFSMTANGVCFDKSKRGFIPDIVTRIYNERSLFKKRMLKLEQEYANTKDERLTAEIARLNNLQMARKIQINSVYGAMGSPYFRYYDLRMAEGITTSGQLAIRWVSNDLNAFMNKACKTEGVDYCIYNDTDSCYFTLETLVEQNWSGKSREEITVLVDKFCASVLQKAINKSYDNLAEYMNAYEQKLIMKREVIADVALFVSKKQYAMSVLNSEGVQYKEPKIKVVGLDLVRSSTPGVVRKVLKDGVKQVLYGDQKSVQDFVAKYRETHLQHSVAEIAFPRGVNGIKKYAGSPIYAKGCPIHVRAALLYNHYIKKLGLQNKYELIGEGSKIKFVHVKMPNPFKEDVIGFIDKVPPEFGLDKYIDYDVQFEKSFGGAMQKLITPLGWNTEHRSSLEDFFG